MVGHITDHSFRRTAANRLVKAEVPAEQIMIAGRWKSQAWKGYAEEEMRKKARGLADVIVRKG